jgi:hypothetical protein
MVDVARIGVATPNVSSSFARASFFGDAVDRQGRWQGSTQQGSSAINALVLQKSPDEKASSSEKAPLQKQEGDWRSFYASNNSYFPPVDYFAQHRERSLLETFRGRVPSSTNEKQSLFA